MTRRTLALAFTAALALPGIAVALPGTETVDDTQRTARIAVGDDGQWWILDSMVHDADGRRILATYYRDAKGVRHSTQVTLGRAGAGFRATRVGKPQRFCRTTGAKRFRTVARGSKRVRLNLPRCAFELRR